MRLHPLCSLPSQIPVGILNSFTARMFNAVYFRSHTSGRRLIGFHEFLYAMDAVQNWNTTYGRRGFIEHQCVIPTGTAGAALRELLEACAKTGRNPFLASIKAFGEPDSGILSFPMRGFTLVLDLPVSPGISNFVAQLDEIVIRYGGRVYLAKDASLDKQRFRAMYPRWRELNTIKATIDPEAIVSSSMARRVGLC